MFTTQIQHGSWPSSTGHGRTPHMHYFFSLHDCSGRCAINTHSVFKTTLCLQRGGGTCPESNAVNLADSSKSCAGSHNSYRVLTSQGASFHGLSFSFRSCEQIGSFLLPTPCLALGLQEMVMPSEGAQSIIAEEDP